MLLGILTACSWPLFSTPIPWPVWFWHSRGRLFHAPLHALLSFCSQKCRRLLSHAQMQSKVCVCVCVLGDGSHRCESCVGRQVPQPPVPGRCFWKLALCGFADTLQWGWARSLSYHQHMNTPLLALLCLLSLLSNRLPATKSWLRGLLAEEHNLRHIPKLWTVLK